MERATRAGLLAVLSWALACATPVEVSTETKPDVDFSQWHSYAQAPAPPASPTMPGYDAAFAEQVQLAIARQMDAKGYRAQGDGPDLRVAFRIHGDPQTRRVLAPDPDATYYTTERFVEGSLVIEIYEHAADRLVWTGVGREPLFARDDREKAAVHAVQAILAELPAAERSP